MNIKLKKALKIISIVFRALCAFGYVAAVIIFMTYRTNNNESLRDYAFYLLIISGVVGVVSSVARYVAYKEKNIEKANLE